MSTNRFGKVYLVGAGPGNPNLLTLKAKKLIEQADVIAYDALIPDCMLASLPANSENIAIGYRGYGSSSLPYQVHPIVIKKAKEGKKVVRLKGGDPFIFGRGSQECQALLEEGIEFEIVAGISSGLAAAVAAGFPLTHKDISSDITFVSGHDLRGGSSSHTNWESVKLVTGSIIIYMTGTKIKENCQRLISLGRDKHTKALVAAGVTSGNEEIFEGTLESFVQNPPKIAYKKPSLIIVGDVIKTRQLFDQRVNRPLYQKTILHIRQRNTQSKLTSLLEEQGAVVIEAPQFLEQPLEQSIEVTEQIEAGDYIVDQVGVFKYFVKNLISQKKDIRSLSSARFYALDEKVANDLRFFGIEPAQTLKGHCLEALKKADLPRSLRIVTRKQGRQSLGEDLQKLNHHVEYLYIYERKEVYHPLTDYHFDGVVFTSSSGVSSFSQSSWSQHICDKKTLFYVIGEKTQKRATQLGYAVKTAQTDSLISLVDLIVADQTKPRTTKKFFSKRNLGL